MIRQLEPTELWSNFADLNAIPRPSYGEAAVIEFIQNFGKKLNLTTRRDKAGNVVIEKPAQGKGMKSRKTVILQAHLDMVCEPPTHPHFKNGVSMVVENGWVKAPGSTLGADNGLGVAAAMGILASKTIPHPPIVGLFTITEETGLVGARALDPKIVKKGDILLNMDTEDDDELCISCAGAIGSLATATYQIEKVDADFVFYKISVENLKGGHSGVEIDKQHGNANKLLTRILFPISPKIGLRLASMWNDSARNVIPRNSTAVVGVKNNQVDVFEKEMTTRFADLKREWATTEPELTLIFEKTKEKPSNLVPPAVQKRLFRALISAPNGVFRMSPEVAGLVETSSNLARVQCRDGKIEVESLQRSSRESSKTEIAEAIRAAFESNGFKIKNMDGYPGWTPNPTSPILAQAEKIYEQVFQKKPKIVNVHAGLECGVIVERLAHLGLDAISFGPNIKGAHSPEERAEVASAQRFWKFLLALLVEIPEKTI
jgi:dipeptidase D